MVSSHNNIGTCDICGSTAKLVNYSNMELCESCADEQRAVVESMKVSMEESKLEAKVKYDASLTVRTDIFNSETASITELRTLINADGRIDNKEFKLHETVQEKINHLKKVIFETEQAHKDKMIELNNRVRANQQFLVENANKLRADEREKLKNQDINYKPATVKISKPKLVSVKKQVDKRKVKELVNELNKEFPQLQLAESVFYTWMVANNQKPEDTYYNLRRKIKESRSEVN